MDSDPQFGQIDDVTTAADQYIKRHYLLSATLVIIALLIVVPIVWDGVVSQDPNVFKLLIIPVFILILGYRFVRNKAEHSFMKQFAAQNNFSYLSRANDLTSTHSTYLERLGRRRFLQDVIAGTYNSIPLRLYNFTTTVGEGKNSHQIEFTVFEMQYPGDVLDIILDSHIHPFGAFILGSLFPGKKKLSLEGDFDKYFSLYVPGGYEMESLEILTPDVMQELMAKSSQFSFEFNSNTLLIFNKQLISRKDQLDDMYAFSRTLVAQLAPVLATLKSTAKT